MTTTNLPETPQKPPSKTHKTRAKQTTQAIELQEAIHRKALAEDTTPRDLAALATAWSRVTDSLRVLRGIPLPGMLRPEESPEAFIKRLKRLRRGQTGALPMLGAGSPPPAAFEEAGEEEETTQATPAETVRQAKESLKTVGG